MPPGFVRREGGTLTLDGRPYRFKGLNIYNANAVNWTCWYNLGEGDRLLQTLDRIGGAQNAFRAWFFQKMATSGGKRDFSPFDRTLEAARARGLKVVATLADQWDSCETGGYRTETWYQEGYRITPDPGMPRAYRDWVAEVVGRYKDHPAILMWQLMNEAEAAPGKDQPCSPTAADSLRAFAEDMAALVKGIDPDHLLSLGTLGGGQCGSSWREYEDLHATPGIDLCEYHDYGHPLSPWPGDPWNGLRLRLDQCRALGKPILIGESGIEAREVGSAAMRAAAFDAKLRERFAQQVAGELIWHWCDPAYQACDPGSYDLIPGDPTLDVLRRY